MNPASERMLRHFDYTHLPSELRAVSEVIAVLAVDMATKLDSADPIVGAEVTTGLRKLLEAKDCFVRAKVCMRE